MVAGRDPGGGSHLSVSRRALEPPDRGGTGIGAELVGGPGSARPTHGHRLASRRAAVNEPLPMNIGLVTPVFPPENGWCGIGVYVHHLAPALAQLGHRVSVLCGYRTEPSVREQDGVRV